MVAQSSKSERRQWRIQRTEAGAAVAECEGLLSPKHDAGSATQHYRAFWQRWCRAAAAGAVLKPSGGNCAVLPKVLSVMCGILPMMFSVRNHHRRNHQSQSHLNQSHQNQGVNSWIILQLQKNTYWLQAENWSKKADELLWAYVLLRPGVLFRLGQSTITMNPRPIYLGIQLRVFGVKSFSTLKMSRSLKMLLPVSHWFIKDWNMEMSNSRASFLCIRLDLWRMKKRM